MCQSECLHYFAQLDRTIQKKSDIENGIWSNWIWSDIHSIIDHVCQVLYKGLVWLFHVWLGAFRSMHVYTDEGEKSGTRETSDKN